MKSVILAAVLFFHGVSFAGVENVISLQREASGTFSVLCDTKGAVTNHAGITADNIRTNLVCGDQIHVALLEEGLYQTNADFCQQTVKWSGEQLQLLLSSPCSGTVVMEKFQEGWYRGKLEGYEFIYEVEIKDKSKYQFYSRSFNTEGEFVKSASNVPSRTSSVKRHADPLRN